MELFEAIKTRRSIGRLKKEPVDKAILEEIIEAACWAPSHHNTQPWTFMVMTGEGRKRLGEGYAKVASESLSELSGEQLEERLAKERSKAMRAPVVIAAVCSPSDDKRAIYAEELAAVQAAVQNLLLAAHAKGLGAIWRSGEPMYHPLMKDALQLAQDEQLVGLIYLGYADMEAPPGKRSAAAHKTIWVEQ